MKLPRHDPPDHQENAVRSPHPGSNLSAADPEGYNSKHTNKSREWQHTPAEEVKLRGKIEVVRTLDALAVPTGSPAPRTQACGSKEEEEEDQEFQDPTDQ